VSSFTDLGRVKYMSHFTGPVIPTEIGGVAENSGTAATVVGKVGGVVGLITGASDGNRSQIISGLNHKAEDGSLDFTALVMNLTAITTRALFIGFTDTVAQENPIEINGTTITSNATDAVGFVYDTAATTDVWYIQGVKTDVDTALKAAVNPAGGGTYVPVAGTYNEFRIIVNTDGLASFYIDGAFVGQVANTVSTTALLTPIVLLETRTGGAATAYIDAISFESGNDQTP
jgi:hypothetical protein